MQMDEGLDTGAMLLTESLPIMPDTTGASLHDGLCAMGGRMIVVALGRLEDGPLSATPQPEVGVTQAHKLGKAESLIDWKQPAEQIERRIRAFSPWPGSRFQHDGQDIKVTGAEVVEGAGPPGKVLDDRLAIACGSGALRLTQLQRPGKGPQPAEAFLRGILLTPIPFWRFLRANLSNGPAVVHASLSHPHRI